MAARRTRAAGCSLARGGRRRDPSPGLTAGGRRGPTPLHRPGVAARLPLLPRPAHRRPDAALPAGLPGPTPRSGSPGRSPSRGPPRSGRGDFHHPAPPWSRLAVTHPQICTTTRGVGRGKSRSKSWNLSHVHRVRWLRRFSHLYHARRACHSRQAKLFRFPLTPK